jgi:hypothetical protein
VADVWLDADRSHGDALVTLSERKNFMSQRAWVLTGIEFTVPVEDSYFGLAVVVGMMESLVVALGVIDRHKQRFGVPWPTAIWVPPRQNLALVKSFYSRNEPGDAIVGFTWRRA